ncbi:GNAT family N-acetyltransferase [Roseivivax sp. CAU 1761]
MAQPAKAENRRVDAFEASTRALTPDDLPLMHELTISVFWPHRARDLELLLSLGQGYLAMDEIGRALGSGMVFRMGDDFAMLGMMITHPRLQTNGVGRWLLDRIMAECAGRDLRLNATRQGYRLYESAGFVPVATVHQHQGTARRITRPAPQAGVDLREMTEADRGAVLALDRAAFGADRQPVLEALLGRSRGLIATRDGTPVGFALDRNFGRGRVIGPIVAETPEMAQALIAPTIAAHEGRFLRVDTPHDDTVFNAFLAAAGLGDFDTVTEMRIGPSRRAMAGAQIFGLAAHTLG